jgi:hypothetical protein
MLLRVIEFSFLYFLLLPFGTTVAKNLSLKAFNSELGKIIIAQLFLGAVFIGIALFMPLKHVSLVYVGLLGYSVYRKKWKIKKRSGIAIIGLVIFSAFATLKSYVPDDGGYYGQTIEAFYNYGLIKGMANLDLRLALTSSFHAFSSTLTWPKLDIIFSFNTFLILLFFLHLYKSASNNSSDKNFYTLTGVFSFPFLLLLSTAPSPDVLVFIVSFLIIDFVLIKKQKFNFHEWFILLGLGLLIKPTLGVTVSAFFFAVKPPSKVKGKHLFFGLVFITLWGFKDYWTTGYLLFPSGFSISTNAFWRVPEAIYDLRRLDLREGVYEQSVLKGLNLLETLNFRLFLNGFKSVLLLAVVALHIVVAGASFKNKRFLKPLVVLVFFSSFWVFNPHFRLGMHLFIPITALVINQLFLQWYRTELKWERILFVIPLGIVLLLVTPTLDLKGVAKNPTYQQIEGFSFTNIFLPDKPKQVQLNSKIICEKLEVNYPKDEDFCFYNSFPCINNKSISSKLAIENKRYCLKLIDSVPSKGFYIKKLKDEE